MMPYTPLYRFVSVNEAIRIELIDIICLHIVVFVSLCARGSNVLQAFPCAQASTRMVGEDFLYIPKQRLRLQTTHSPSVKQIPTEKHRHKKYP